MAAIDFLQSIGDFSDRCLNAGGLDGAFQQISGSCLGVTCQRVKSSLDLGLVALGLQSFQLFQLLPAHGAVVDFENGDVRIAVRAVFIHADDGLAA